MSEHEPQINSVEDLTRRELEQIALKHLPAEDIEFMAGEDDGDFIGFLVGTLEAEFGIPDGAVYLIEQGAILRTRKHQPEIREIQNRGEPFATGDIERMVEELEARERGEN